MPPEMWDKICSPCRNVFQRSAKVIWGFSSLSSQVKWVSSNVCLFHLKFTLCENIKGNLYAETLEGTHLVSLNYGLIVITSVNTLWPGWTRGMMSHHLPYNHSTFKRPVCINRAQTRAYVFSSFNFHTKRNISPWVFPQLISVLCRNMILCTLF